MLVAIHDVTASELTRAFVLLQRHAQLGARDAMLAAVALNRGLAAIVTADRGFDGIPGLPCRSARRSSGRVAPRLTGPVPGYGAPSPASSRARSSTASVIGSVRRPVNVFCWLGW